MSTIKHKTISFEEHLQIAKDLNDYSNRLSEILLLVFESKGRKFPGFKLLYKMVGGGGRSIIGKLRSLLEDEMFKNYSDHPDMPKGLEATHIYYPPGRLNVS